MTVIIAYTFEPLRIVARSLVGFAISTNRRIVFPENKKLGITDTRAVNENTLYLSRDLLRSV